MTSFADAETIRGLDASEIARARVLISSIQRGQRVIARAEGAIADALAELAEIAHAQGERSGGSNGPEYARRSMAAEVAAATRVHPSSARARMNDAEVLVHDFPSTHAALSDGEISARHAKVIADAGLGLECDQRARLDEHAHLLARTRTPGEMGRIARVQAGKLAPRTAAQRHLDAREERAVTVADLEDGMSRLVYLGPSFHVHAVHDRLTRLARVVGDERRTARASYREAHGGKQPEGGWDALVTGVDGTSPADAARASDGRSLAQLRADLLADLLLSAEPTGHELHAGDASGSLRNVQAQVQILIPARLVTDAAAGVFDAGTAAGDADVTVAADAALATAAAATGWDRIFASPITGDILAVDGYRPTASQRRRLTARDRVCRHPGCTVPARDCDVDHTHDFARGGKTTVDNLECLCEAHHVMKHQSGWRIRQLCGGVVEWTSPTGEVYTDEPPSRVVFRDLDGALADTSAEERGTTASGAGAVEPVVGSAGQTMGFAGKPNAGGMTGQTELAVSENGWCDAGSEAAPFDRSDDERAASSAFLAARANGTVPAGARFLRHDATAPAGYVYEIVPERTAAETESPATGEQEEQCEPLAPLEWLAKFNREWDSIDNLHSIATLMFEHVMITTPPARTADGVYLAGPLSARIRTDVYGGAALRVEIDADAGETTFVVGDAVTPVRVSDAATTVPVPA